MTAVMRAAAVIGTRRLIFLLLATLLILSMILPLGAGALLISGPTQAVYDAIEKLEPGSPVLISFDFDPPSRPELYPSSRAILRHAFRKKLRVFVMVLWPAGKGLAAEAIELEASLARAQSDGASGKDAYPVYGKDYLFLGFQPGQDAVIVRLTEGLQGAFAKDDAGQPTDNMPIWTGANGDRVRQLSDLSLVVTLSAGYPGIDEWIRYGRGKQEFPLAAAVTAVTGPAKMTFLKSGQIVGLVNGMRGAAEYELLVNRSQPKTDETPLLQDALSGMNTLSASHFLIIALVAVSNVTWMLSRRKGAS